jgi:hypothetical protein
MVPVRQDVLTEFRPSPMRGAGQGPRALFTLGNGGFLLLSWRHGQWFPAGDGPGACPRMRVVGHAWEQPAQLDRG